MEEDYTDEEIASLQARLQELRSAVQQKKRAARQRKRDRLAKERQEILDRVAGVEAELVTLREESRLLTSRLGQVEEALSAESGSFSFTDSKRRGMSEDSVRDLDDLSVEAVRGVSLASSHLRERAVEYTRLQAGHETHAESLDGGIGDDDPSSTDPIGHSVLRETTAAHACSSLADSLRCEADHLDSSASVFVPPDVVHAQIQEYERVLKP